MRSSTAEEATLNPVTKQKTLLQVDSRPSVGGYSRLGSATLEEIRVHSDRFVV